MKDVVVHQPQDALMASVRSTAASRRTYGPWRPPGGLLHVPHACPFRRHYTRFWVIQSAPLSSENSAQLQSHDALFCPKIAHAVTQRCISSCRVQPFANLKFASSYRCHIGMNPASATTSHAPSHVNSQKHASTKCLSHALHSKLS